MMDIFQEERLLNTLDLIANRLWWCAAFLFLLAVPKIAVFLFKLLSNFPI